MQSNSNWLIINKFLIWCEITKPFSGPVVQFFFNPGNKLIGYSTEVRSFGDVLPDETVHILIGSTFPRMVRFTKIETNFQFFRYFLMFCKFFSIVCRYCMYQVFYRLQRFDGLHEEIQVSARRCRRSAPNRHGPMRQLGGERRQFRGNSRKVLSFGYLIKLLRHGGGRRSSLSEERGVLIVWEHHSTVIPTKNKSKLLQIPILCLILHFE